MSILRKDKEDMKKIAIINGPNINILGEREKMIYGTETWENIEKKIKELAKEMNIKLICFQSNHEGDIVDFIQNNIEDLSGVVINPAAFSKTGYSVLEALTAQDIPYVEVHMTNIVHRGGWHSESIFTANAVSFLMGLKGYIYELGIKAINYYLEER